MRATIDAGPADLDRRPSRPITGAEIEDFRRDGAVCLRGILDLGWIEMLREAVEDAMASPSPLHKEYGAAANTKRFFGDYNMWQRMPAFRKFSCDSPAPEIVATLMGSRRVNLYNEHLLVKEPGSLAPTPWHQDAPYFRVTGHQNASIWVGLDKVTGNTGAMSFVRGSHKSGKVYRPAQFRSGRAAESGGEFADLPDIDAHPEDFDLVSWDLEPGDCTVHHALTLHGSPGNASASTRRRALSVRYAGDDARWRQVVFSAEEQQAAYAQLDADVPLKTGDRLDGAQFPVVFERERARRHEG